MARRSVTLSRPVLLYPTSHELGECTRDITLHVPARIPVASTAKLERQEDPGLDEVEKDEINLFREVASVCLLIVI